jgi:hypothetical protein
MENVEIDVENMWSASKKLPSAMASSSAVSLPFWRCRG